MIEEIPVSAGNVLDIRAHGDEESARLEAPVRIRERLADSFFIGQMPQEVAGEYGIECPFG